ncbi:MAG: acyltransferase [Actinomycetota bacterium]
MPAGEQVMERPTTNTSASSPASVVPPSVEYRPALDGLRALAVTAVLAFHLDRLPGGNLGVDAFFVISGWLITWKLLGEVDARGSIDLRRFWTARARRLMPASLGVLVVVSVIWPIAGIAVPSLRRDVMWAALWSSNWGTITGGGDYWARFGDPSPITHFWSLAIEEQFYLVWPVVLLVFARRGASRRTVGFAAAALAALSMTLMVIMADPANPTAVYMNTLARAHSLLAGAAAAAFTITRPSGSIRGGIAARRLLPFASLAAVAIVVLSSHSSAWLFTWGFPAFAVAMVVVVVAAADGAASSLLASPPMRWLSDRSYGLYLWHWPVFLFFSADRTGLHGVVLDAVRVLVAVGISDISYRYLETPIRRGPWVRTRWVPLVVGTAIVGVIAIAAVAVPRPSGAEVATVVTLPPAPDVASMGPVPPSAAAPSAAVSAHPAAGADVPTQVPGPGRNDEGAGTETADRPGAVVPDDTVIPVARLTRAEPVRVLVAGDSTAQLLAEILLPYAQANPAQLIAGSAAFPGCGLSVADDGRLHGFTGKDGEHDLIDLRGCLGQWGAIADRVSGPEQIEVVVVQIGPWDGADIHLQDGRVVSVGDPVGRAMVVDSYTSFVERMHEAGAVVVWVTPADIALQWGAVDDPMNDPARWAALRQVVDALEVPQIDLPGWLAREGLDGPDGRPDGVHLSPQVNERFLLELVVPELERIAASTS